MFQYGQLFSTIILNSLQPMTWPALLKLVKFSPFRLESVLYVSLDDIQPLKTILKNASDALPFSVENTRFIAVWGCQHQHIPYY